MILKFGVFKQQYYKGIFEKAAHGLHEAVMQAAGPYLEKCHVLDIGCGEGAFTQRLSDRGCTVDVCDLDIEQIRVQGVNKIRIDLNEPDFEKKIQGRYDAVTALEIIEHIENPWKLLRDASAVLKPGGILVLSTPNIASFPSRLRFFLRGTFVAFERGDLKHGHISAMPYFQLEHIFHTLGYQILVKTHGGIIPLFHFYHLSRFTVLRNTILPFLIPFMRGPKYGRALIYVLKKK